jgi:hypothetical protein
LRAQLRNWLAKATAIRTEFPLPTDPAGIPNAGHSKPARVYCQGAGGAWGRPVRRSHCSNRSQKTLVSQILLRKAAPPSRFFRCGVSIIAPYFEARKVWIAMISLTRLAGIVSIGSFFAALAVSPLLAQTVKSQTEAQDPTTIDSVAASLENTAHSLEKNGGLRGSNMQWHSPANATEYRALARYVPVLVVVVSQDESELPLKRVYVDADGGTTELKRISRVRSVDPTSFTSKILGKYRETSYYLLPVALLSSQGKLVADFAVHRTGYQLAVLTDPPLAFVQADSHPLPFPGDTPDQTVLHDFVKRHFQDMPLQD